MDYNLVLQNVFRHITLDKEEISYFTSLLSYKEIGEKNLCCKQAISRSISTSFTQAH